MSTAILAKQSQMAVTGSTTQPPISEQEFAELCRLRDDFFRAEEALEKAEAQYSERLNELHARIPKPAATVETTTEKPEPVKPKRERLFDVTYYLPNRSIQTLAVDEEDAYNRAADSVNLQYIVKPAKSRRHRVPLFHKGHEVARKRATK